MKASHTAQEGASRGHGTSDQLLTGLRQQSLEVGVTRARAAPPCRPRPPLKAIQGSGPLAAAGHDVALGWLKGVRGGGRRVLPSQAPDQLHDGFLLHTNSLHVPRSQTRGLVAIRKGAGGVVPDRRKGGRLSTCADLQQAIRGASAASGPMECRALTSLALPHSQEGRCCPTAETCLRQSCPPTWEPTGTGRTDTGPPSPICK